MAKAPKLTAERARELLDYDPETGVLRWKESKPHSKRKAGDIAGGVLHKSCGKSYGQIRIDRRMYKTHRVIWLMVHGVWAKEIDHADGNGLNNRLNNLSSVSRVENQRNKKLSYKNKYGCPGIYEVTGRKKKFRVQISNGSCQLLIGAYYTLDEAVAARKQAEIDYGYHPNHGTERPL